MPGAGAFMIYSAHKLTLSKSIACYKYETRKLSGYFNTLQLTAEAARVAFLQEVSRGAWWQDIRLY